MQEATRDALNTLKVYHRNDPWTLHWLGIIEDGLLEEPPLLTHQMPMSEADESILFDDPIQLE